MHTMVYIYNETWSKLGGYALVRVDVCVLWSKENMEGGMGCPLRGIT